MTMWRSEMETASTHVLLVDTVETTDRPQFRAPATVYISYLCLMDTRILMASLLRFRRAQPAARLRACTMGLASWTVLTLSTVPVWLATQARGVKMWWDATGLRCPPMDPLRVCFITLGRASLSVVILDLSCGAFPPPSA